MFKFIGKRKRRIAELEERLEEVLVEFGEVRNESYMKGEHLLDQPFIPEYLLFKEHPQIDKDGNKIGTVYHRDGVNIIRPYGSDNYAILSNDEKINVKAKFDNMLHAIITLQCLGMKGVSVKEYIKKSQEDSKLIEKDLYLEY